MLDPNAPIDDATELQDHIAALTMLANKEMPVSPHKGAVPKRGPGQPAASTARDSREWDRLVSMPAPLDSLDLPAASRSEALAATPAQPAQSWDAADLIPIAAVAVEVAPVAEVVVTAEVTVTPAGPAAVTAVALPRSETGQAMHNAAHAAPAAHASEEPAEKAVAAHSPAAASDPSQATGQPTVTSNVRVDVEGQPPGRSIDHPVNDEERSALANCLRLTDAGEIAAKLLNAGGADALPTWLRGLYETMLNRAVSVLQVPRPQVEAVMLSGGVRVQAKLPEIHEWAARNLRDRIDTSIQYRRVYAQLPRQLHDILIACDQPDLHASIVFSDIPGTWNATVFLFGDLTREAKNVLVVPKPDGVGGQIEAEGFRFEIGDANGDYPSLVTSFVERLAQSLRDIDALRRNASPAMMGAMTRADRAQVERMVGWAEQCAAQGRPATKVLATLAGLHVSRFPELARRLATVQADADSGQLPPDRLDAERWIAYIESAAERGYRYERGIAEVFRMNIAGWPDLAERFRIAVLASHRQTAERWLAQVEEAASRGAFYSRGIDKLGKLDLQRFPDLEDRLHAALALASTDGRTAVASALAPEIGRLAVLPSLSHPVYVQNLGREFAIDERTVEQHGPHLIAHLGETGRYVSWRLPTASEWKASAA